MPDREKVEFIESYIKVQGGDYQWNDNHGELIRCENCRYGEKCTLPHRDYWCNNMERYTQPEWFCADGKPKEV